MSAHPPPPPLLLAVWLGNHAALSPLAIGARTQEELRDALSLALRLGECSCAEALLDAGAPVSVAYDSLIGARAYWRTLPFLYSHPSLPIRTLALATAAAEAAKRSVLARMATALRVYPDVDLVVRVAIESSLPLVSHLLPHDDLRIIKRGAAVRISFSLTGGFDRSGFKHGRASFLLVDPNAYAQTVGGASTAWGRVFLIDHDGQRWAELTADAISTMAWRRDAHEAALAVAVRALGGTTPREESPAQPSPTADLFFACLNKATSALPILVSATPPRVTPLRKSLLGRALDGIASLWTRHAAPDAVLATVGPFADCTAFKVSSTVDIALIPPIAGGVPLVEEWDRARQRRDEMAREGVEAPTTTIAPRTGVRGFLRGALFGGGGGDQPSSIAPPLVSLSPPGTDDTSSGDGEARAPSPPTPPLPIASHAESLDPRLLRGCIAERETYASCVSPYPPPEGVCVTRSAIALPKAQQRIRRRIRARVWCTPTAPMPAALIQAMCASPAAEDLVRAVLSSVPPATGAPVAIVVPIAFGLSLDVRVIAVSEPVEGDDMRVPEGGEWEDATAELAGGVRPFF